MSEHSFRQRTLKPQLDLITLYSETERRKHTGAISILRVALLIAVQNAAEVLWNQNGRLSEAQTGRSQMRLHYTHTGLFPKETLP